jgi:hypothetical protein
MVKKSFLLVMLFAFVFLASGCVTVYTDGCCPDRQSARCSKKSTKGATETGPNMVKKADDWVKKNLW